MRKLLLSSAVALALPAVAAAGTPGFVDLSIATTDIEGVDIDTYTAGGSVVAPIAGNWNVQFDAETTRYDASGDRLSGSALAAHAFVDQGNWLVGGRIGHQSLFGIGVYTLGAEAQVTSGAFVVEGGFDIGALEAGDDNADLFKANASATWFANPDLAFTGGINYQDLDGLFDVTQYKVDGEYRFDGSSFSVFAGYAYTDYDGSGESDTWSLGLRYGFGDGSLQQRRDEGPRWLRSSTTFLFGGV